MTLPPDTILAAGPVIIEDNKVLLNRELKKNGQESGYLIFPGGGVESEDVDLESACRREAKEEMGIDIDIIRPLNTLMLQRPDKFGLAILVHYLAKRIGEIKPGYEVVEWGWYDINKLPTNCAPNVYMIIEDYKKSL